jgi:hypothetical protein
MLKLELDGRGGGGCTTEDELGSASCWELFELLSLPSPTVPQEDKSNNINVAINAASEKERVVFIKPPS